MILRKATSDDVARIEEVMRESMAGLGPPFYDAVQTASAVVHIAVVDRQLIDDGTYFVIVIPSVSEGPGGVGGAMIEPPARTGPSLTLGMTIVACGGWSSRKKLFTGTGDSAQEHLDPKTDAARIRAMFVLPSYARKGLGRMILEAAENDARQRGFTRFELMATLPGVPLYEACGYKREEEVPLQLPDGVTVGGVRMVK